MKSDRSCLDCEGSGIFRDKVSTCPFCEGTGEMTQKQRNSYHNWVGAMPPDQKQALLEAKNPDQRRKDLVKAKFPRTWDKDTGI
jgi:RecJ-like exonuclease